MNKLEEINEAQNILSAMGFSRDSSENELRRIKIGERVISNNGKMKWYEESVFGELERKYAKILLEVGQQYINEIKNVINKNIGEPLIPIKEINTIQDDKIQEILGEIDLIECGEHQDNYGEDTNRLIKEYLTEYIKIANLIDDYAKEKDIHDLNNETYKNVERFLRCTNDEDTLLKAEAMGDIEAEYRHNFDESGALGTQDIADKVVDMIKQINKFI